MSYLDCCRGILMSRFQPSHSYAAHWSKDTFAVLVAIGLAALLASARAEAAVLTWDADSGAANPQDGSGNWDTVTPNWISGGANLLWTSGNDAVFGAGGTGTATVTLTEAISAAGITFNAGAAYTLAGSTLTRTGLITVNAAEARIDSVLAGPRINKYGTGTLILAGNNTVGSDALDIHGGVVSLRHNNALGNHEYAHVYEIGTAVEVQDNITVANGIYIKDHGIAGTGSLRSVSGDNTWAGFVRMHWGQPDCSIGVDAGSKITITGTVEASGGSNGALRKVGAGTLVLTANNPYHWPTYVEAGVLNIRHNNALGTTAGGTTVNGGAALEVQGGITVAEALTLNGALDNPSLLRSVSGANVWSGSVNVAGTGASNIQVDTGSTLTLSGSMAGSQYLRKAGAGTLVLSGDNSGYNQLMEVTAGVVSVRHNNALGTTAGGTTVNSGAALEVQGSITVGESLSISGSGIGGSGVLRSVSGNNVWNGAIMHNAASIGVDSGTLTINGQISGAEALIKVGAGTLVLTNENTYTGPTNVSVGTVDLRHGDALGTGNVNVANGARIRVQGNIAVTTGVLTLNGGVGLQNVADKNTWNTNIGPGASGSNTIQVDAGSTLTFAGSFVDGLGYFYKSGTGTLALAGDNSGFTRHMDVAEGVAVLSSANGVPGEYFHVTTASAMVELTGGITVAANMASGTVRKIYLTGAATSDNLAALNSTNGTNTWNGSVVLHSAGDKKIGAAAGSTLVLAGVVSGAADRHLVKIDAGTLVLGGANTYLGTTRVAAGTLLVNGALNGGGAVTVNAGATLGGTGRIAGLVGGAGLVSPGASAGILAVATIDPTTGMDFAFEFGRTGSPDYAKPAASINDVLRLTSNTPATGPLDPDNTIDVYLGVTELELRDVFRGGVYVDAAVDASDRALFLATVADASYNYYVLGDGDGTHAFGGLDYYALAEYDSFLRVEISAVAETANFGGSPVYGSVLQFQVVPEPTLPTLVLLVLPALLLRRRKPRITG